MLIAALYSHCGGLEYLRANRSNVLTELEQVISSIDAERCRLKVPKDKELTRAARVGIRRFYSPPHLNTWFDAKLHELGWDIKPRVYTNDKGREGFREIDACKDKVGLELQFGKYSFLTYDIVAKMVIMKNLGMIDSGIEVCPMAAMLPHMSSGIGAFEQVVWDLSMRGASSIDVPAIVVGVVSAKLSTRPGLSFNSDNIAEYEVVQTAVPRLHTRRSMRLTATELQRLRDIDTGIALLDESDPASMELSSELQAAIVDEEDDSME